MKRVSVKSQKGPGAQNLNNAIKNLKNITGKVGWFSSARYEDKYSTPVASVAMLQEYGSPAHNIPSRSFMRTTITDHEKEWQQKFKEGSKNILEKSETSKSVITKMCLLAVGQIKQKISEIYEPPLKPRTILNRMKRAGILTTPLKERFTKNKLTPNDKKSIGNLTKPLVDTGTLLTTCTFEVSEE